MPDRKANDWKILPCQNCRSAVFWADHSEREKRMRIFCASCRTTLVELEAVKK